MSNKARARAQICCHILLTSWPQLRVVFFSCEDLHCPESGWLKGRWAIPSLKSHCCSAPAFLAIAFPRLFPIPKGHRVCSGVAQPPNLPSIPLIVPVLQQKGHKQHFLSPKCTAQMRSPRQTKATAALFTRKKDQWASMKGQEADVLTVTCW